MQYEQVEVSHNRAPWLPLETGMSLPNSLDVRTGRRPPGDPQLRERDERIDSLKAVAGKLAHDFNNFLAPQFGYLTLLKDEIVAGSAAATYITAMDGSAQKAEGYVSEILLGVRPYRQFTPREFQFDAVLREIVERWSAETPPNTELLVSAELERLRFWGDEKQWRAVFEHLLANARFALVMGGRLDITLRREFLSGEEVERLGLGTEDAFCLRVSDNGFGMNAEVARRAFEPFFTTRTQIKAAGLGLTIAHGITLFHGGQVELSTNEDQGTTITLWLPARGPERMDRLPEAKPGGQAKPRKQVLLIADDPLIKEVLRGWLGAHGLETETVNNEKDARRSLQRAGANFLLIISETDLKSGRGEDLYHALSDLRLASSWVFLSGRRTPQLPGIDCASVIKKPFSQHIFSDVVKRYMRA